VVEGFHLKARVMGFQERGQGVHVLERDAVGERIDGFLTLSLCLEIGQSGECATDLAFFGQSTEGMMNDVSLQPWIGFSQHAGNRLQRFVVGPLVEECAFETLMGGASIGALLQLIQPGDELS
jgi:hypothetical protein